MNNLIVYLAGGMRGDWRETVGTLVKRAVFINPKDNEMAWPSEYTVWDLTAVRLSDVVFAYLEKDNPSGLGLMLEIGYGKALGKTVIFVDEQNTRYSQIGRYTADVFFDTLTDGINFLRKLTRIKTSVTRR